MKKLNHKALQLCGEVARTLSYALAWECGDPLLGLLQVEAVTPAPDAGRLLVTVSLPKTAAPDDAEQCFERLRRSTGRLRAAVAEAIQRRKVPELTFRLAVRKGVNE